MVIAVAILIFLFSVFGIYCAFTQMKEDKKAKTICLAICFPLAVISALFILITFYFAWAVRMN
jgi:hypothetical protein